MFNSTILDMVVLLFFTYFITSLLITVLNEMIATIKDFRAKELEKTLNTLLFDPNWGAYVANYIKKSPHYQSLIKDVTSKPSYIPAENFAMAVLDSLRSAPPNQALTITGIRNTLSAAPANVPPELQKILVGYLDDVNIKVEDFQKKIEGFYNNAMDRAGGWYKRKIKAISIAVSFGLVIFLNIDTIEIIRKSTQDPVALKATADRIAEAVPYMRIDTAGNEFYFVYKDTTGKKRVRIGTDSMPVASLDSIMKQYDGFNGIKSQLDNSVYTIGFKSWDDFKDEWWQARGNWPPWACLLLKIFGLCLTVLALQAGSTYWFDALNKVINLRGTGAKPNNNKK